MLVLANVLCNFSQGLHGLLKWLEGLLSGSSLGSNYYSPNGPNFGRHVHVMLKVVSSCKWCLRLTQLMRSIHKSSYSVSEILQLSPTDFVHTRLDQSNDKVRFH